MEHDLHSLLAAARDDAPPPRLSIDDITTAGRRLARRRRRSTLLASIAGGVAAVITGATAAVVLFSPQTVTPTADPNGNPGLADVSQSPARRADFAPADAFQTNFTGYTSGRYSVSDPYLVTAGYQVSTIDLNAVTPSPSTTVSGKPARTSSPTGYVPRAGRLVVYNPDAFSTRQFTGGKLTISGRTALLGEAGDPGLPDTAGKYDCCADPIVPTLAWQYLPDAWAAIYWSTPDTIPTRDELLALAQDLPPADPSPFPVGIRFRNNLPKGYRLIAAGTRTSSSDNVNLSVVRLALKPLGGPFVAPADFDGYPSLVLTLGITDQVTGEVIGKSTCPPATNRCATLIEQGQFYLQVESTGDRPLSANELSTILKTLTAEDPTDSTSWPAATEAFTP